MPLAHHKGRSIFFAHVPKTGGSSVEDYLAHRFGPLSLLDVNKQSGQRGTGLVTPATHLATVDLAELLPRDLGYSFTVVRDPLSRMMSEFRYQSRVSRMSRLGFSTWLRVMLRATRIEPRLYQNHIRPQCDLVPEVSEVFRLEDGLEAIIARLDEVTADSRPDLVIQHLNARTKDHIELSRQDAELITGFYVRDYDRFGYPRPLAETLYSDPIAVLRDVLAVPLARALVLKQRADWIR